MEGHVLRFYAPSLEVVHVTFAHFYWPELSHAATPNSKGGWEMSSALGPRIKEDGHGELLATHR